MCLFVCLFAFCLLLLLLCYSLKINFFRGGVFEKKAVSLTQLFLVLGFVGGGGLVIVVASAKRKKTFIGTQTHKTHN